VIALAKDTRFIGDAHVTMLISCYLDGVLELKEFNAYKNAEGRITRLPAKLSKKNKLSLALLEVFEFDVEYSEPELNEILKAYLDDFALVRRTLVDMGYLERDRYGRTYRRVAKAAELA
jgi:hypothetical protein